MKDTPLTITQVRVLSLLNQGEKTGPELRGALGVEADENGNFSQLMERLHGACYVARRDHDHDRRIWIYTLTEPGLAVLTQTFDIVLARSAPQSDKPPQRTLAVPTASYRPQSESNLVDLKAAHRDFLHWFGNYPDSQPKNQNVMAAGKAIKRLSAVITRMIETP